MLPRAAITLQLGAVGLEKLGVADRAVSRCDATFGGFENESHLVGDAFVRGSMSVVDPRAAPLGHSNEGGPV